MGRHKLHIIIIIIIGVWIQTVSLVTSSEVLPMVLNEAPAAASSNVPIRTTNNKHVQKLPFVQEAESDVPAYSNS